MAKVNFKPAGNRLLVEPYEPIRKTKLGVIIPDSAADRPKRGVVVAIGPEVDRFKEGDHVHYGQYSGTEVDLDTTESADEKVYLIMMQTDVYGVIPVPRPPAEELTKEHPPVR